MKGGKGSMKQVLNLEGKRLERDIACFNERENGSYHHDKKIYIAKTKMLQRLKGVNPLRVRFCQFLSLKIILF